MKPEHDEVIEAMAVAMFVHVTDSMREDLKSALRAAAERGWVLAKLPERKPYDFKETLEHKTMTVAHNYCLDAIETIELEEK